MKTLLKHLLFLMVLSLPLFNCSNDDDNFSEDPTPSPVLTRPTAYSINTIEFYLNYNTDDYISGYDSNNTNYSRSVVYNAQDQIIQFGPRSFTYNAQGRISQITEANTSTFINKTTSIVYNNEGRIATQNLRFTYASSGNSVSVRRTFEYNGNGQLTSITEENASYYTRDLMTYDSRGNIVLLKRQSSPDGVTYTDQDTISFTYDDKKNPGKEMLRNMGIDSNFSLIRLSFSDTMYFGNYAFFRLNYYSNNNITSSQWTYATGYTNKTYNYVYNDNDYPTAAEETTDMSDGTNYTSYKNWTYETYE